MADEQNQSQPKALNNQVASRVIKFRAWQPHPSLHRKPGMYEVTDIVFYPEHGGGEVFLAKPYEEAKGSEYLEDIELMQYTGLKDKNGVEVYEGDVVRCSRGCPHVIEWREYYGGTYIGGMPGWYLSGLKEGYTWMLDKNDPRGEEVIGNIYETPELMK